jgi:hypothetical protein
MCIYKKKFLMMGAETVSSMDICSKLTQTVSQEDFSVQFRHVITVPIFSASVTSVCSQVVAHY